MFSITTCIEDMMKKLNAINASRSTGPDGLHCKFFLELKDRLCGPLSHF